MKRPTNETYLEWCKCVVEEEGYTLSTNTLRTYDLCDKALDLLKAIDPEFVAEQARDYPEGQAEFERLSELPWSERGMNEEPLEYLWEDLYHRLEEIAPQGFIFESLPGDGAHLGLFKHEE